jgi:hypothetical protein
MPRSDLRKVQTTQPEYSHEVNLNLVRWIALGALIYALFAGLRTVGDPDLGWQLATGRWIVEHHRVPFTDVLSYTANGREWIYPVLSQAFLYCAYAIGGYSLLSWLSAAACVGTVAILLRRAPLATAVLAVVAVPLVVATTPALASMFTEVLFAAFLSVLWHYHRSGSGPLWILPVLMGLWTNLHLGFVAGLGMCAAYVLLELGELLFGATRPAAMKRLRRATPWLIGTALATLVNPWGARVYLAIARQGDINRIHGKWISYWMPMRITPGTLADGFAWRVPGNELLWLIAVAVVAVFFALYLRRIAPALILGTSLYFVIHATRFQGPFAAIVVVVGGAMLSDAFEIRWIRRTWKRLASVGGKLTVPVAMVLGSLLVAFFVGERVWDLVSNRYYLRTPYQFAVFGAGESSWYPEQAATFMLREQLPANMFNDFNAGGFIAWKLGPAYLDYIDGRAVPFGGQQFLHAQELVNGDPNSVKWQAEAEARGINTVILSLHHEGGAGLVSVDKFCESTLWRAVYLDPQAEIVVRVSPDTAGLISRLQLDCSTVQFDQPPAASSSRGRAEQFNYYLNAASLLIALGRDNDAMIPLAKAERIFSENAFLHYAKGIALQHTYHWNDAERELRASVELYSADAPYALARLYDEQGRYAEEVAVLAPAVERSFQPYSLYLKLGLAQLAIRQPRSALKSFDQAEKWSPYIDEGYELGAAFREQIAEGRRRANDALEGRVE